MLLLRPIRAHNCAAGDSGLGWTQDRSGTPAFGVVRNGTDHPFDPAGPALENARYVLHSTDRCGESDDLLRQGKVDCSGLQPSAVHNVGL